MERVAYVDVLLASIEIDQNFTKDIGSERDEVGNIEQLRRCTRLIVADRVDRRKVYGWLSKALETQRSFSCIVFNAKLPDFVEGRIDNLVKVSKERDDDVEQKARLGVIKEVKLYRNSGNN